MPRLENMVDFSEIFEFAEKYHNIEWNDCCRMFHNNHILIDDEGKNSSFELDYVNEVLKDPVKNIWRHTIEKQKAWEIIKDFMEFHSITTMYVENDF